MELPDDQLNFSDFSLWDPLAPRHLPASGNAFEEFNEAWPSLKDEWCFQTYFPEFANEYWMNKSNTANNLCRDTIFNEGKIDNGGSLSLGLRDEKEDGKLKLTGARDTIRKTVERCFSESSLSSVNTPEGGESSSPRKRRRIDTQELSVGSPLSCMASYTQCSAASQSAATPVFSPLDESPFYSSNQNDGSELDLQIGFDNGIRINRDMIDVDAELGQWDWNYKSPQFHPQQTHEAPDLDRLMPLEMPDGTVRFTTNWLPATSEEYSTDGTSDTDIWLPMNAS